MATKTIQTSDTDFQMGNNLKTGPIVLIWLETIDHYNLSQLACMHGIEVDTVVWFNGLIEMLDILISYMYILALQYWF